VRSSTDDVSLSGQTGRQKRQSAAREVTKNAALRP
jgi:hypothetical protein